MTDLFLIILIIGIPLIAEIFVKGAYNKYSKVSSGIGLTGAEVARKILKSNGLDNIYVVETKGTLTDHYDPSRKVIRLSNGIYDKKSISALAVAAHECGHAIQDKENYTFLRIRSAIFPIVNILSSISYYIILIGFIFEFLDLVYLGILFSVAGLLFQIITLPVEFDASNRAKKELLRLKLIDKEEAEGVSSVLGAAAMTYVAGVLASAIQILRLLLIANSRRD